MRGRSSRPSRPLAANRDRHFRTVSTHTPTVAAIARKFAPEQPPVDIFDLVRLIALTRLAIPRARVRLAAGRTRLTREGQALCFFAGANSIFYGDKLLTARNPAADADVALLRELGLQIEPKEEPADICD